MPGEYFNPQAMGYRDAAMPAAELKEKGGVVGLKTA